ncbi:tyrosine-type recombinase/integrase [Streptomyces sp. LaBMicrA B280]|uniref:tyrosine-type recombinase/integrase n=1 Tax=Streptomyces sp. LaBMicrA B280 TaxID=3391001 RepID=UPI003BA7BB32
MRGQLTATAVHVRLQKVGTDDHPGKPGAPGSPPPARSGRAFWAWAIVEVLRHTGMRIEEALELTHHSFVAYQLPTTGEIVPMLQVAPSKLDQERLLLVSPELGEVLTAIIHRVRRGQQAMPLVSVYDSLERLWSAPMPFLFQRRCGPEDRAIPRNYIYTCLNDALAASGLTGPGNEQLRYMPHDFRRIFVTDALRSGLPPHIAARICGHRKVDTTLGYAKARELHQTGAKSQVTCLRRRPDGPQRYYELAF